MEKRVVFLFQPIRVGDRDKLECPVIPHGHGLIQLDFSKTTAAEKSDQAVAVQDLEVLIVDFITA